MTYSWLFIALVVDGNNTKLLRCVHYCKNEVVLSVGEWMHGWMNGWKICDGLGGPDDDVDTISYHHIKPVFAAADSSSGSWPKPVRKMYRAIQDARMETWKLIRRPDLWRFVQCFFVVLLTWMF